MPITSEEWLRLSPYLDEALALSDDELAIWLRALRDDTPKIADLLESLLSEQRELSADGFLEAGPVDFAEQPGLAGQVIGAYKLVSPIGVEGMGSVWMAERADGRFERRVAIKFLNIALNGQSGRRTLQT